MRHYLYFFILAVFFLSGCNKEENNIFHEKGTVVDYAGSGNCGFIIELDNGQNILPLTYPENFVFAEGQEVSVEYSLIFDRIMLCEKGTPCDLKSIDQITCAPYIGLNFSNYGSLARDPVYIHEIYVDCDCLHIKLSYSGGCKEHIVELARMLPECGTPPVPPPAFEISHNANGDMCEAYITREFRFDLSPLKAEGQKKFTVSAPLSGGQVFNETFEYNW